MTMSEQTVAALAAEEAAIYAYGIVGVKMTTKGEVDEARAAERAHRERRDYLVGQMDQPQSSPAGYEMPFPVTDRAAALKLAIQVEDGVAQAWRPVLAVTQDTERTNALAAMTDAAVRATRWRKLAKLSPTTMAFPGRAN
jgi:uncharacterized protein DUF4439